tara:strand:+ start:441 stop:848 length:408 start_codon:yes stop_codon:yes gene_type:complete
MSQNIKYPTAKTRAGQYRQVFEGRADRTRSGLTKNDLMLSAGGRVVSRKAHQAGLQRGGALVAWRHALTRACEEMGVDYNIPKKGTPLYKLAREYYDADLAAGGGKSKKRKRTKSSKKKKKKKKKKKNKSKKKRV